MKSILSPRILEKLARETAAGREAWKNGAIGEAEKHFLEAWNALPDPKTKQDFYSQDLSWGMTAFDQATQQYDKAKRWLDIVRQVYGGGPDASVDFLAGTVTFDSGDLGEAYRLFDDLFLRYGSRPFEGSDSKYLKFYQKASKR